MRDKKAKLLRKIAGNKGNEKEYSKSQVYKTAIVYEDNPQPIETEEISAGDGGVFSLVKKVKHNWSRVKRVLPRITYFLTGNHSKYKSLKRIYKNANKSERREILQEMQSTCNI